MKKRLLSVLLLLCMLLTLLPTAAFAEEAHEHVYEEAFACICSSFSASSTVFGSLALT